ncbi:MAG: class I SAM-dependent methyltransferase [Deltaproteobacteria bacterium]|nr:class I SAM-dependent methyltransferase [Deltaproteobacteria bacterium]
MNGLVDHYNQLWQERYVPPYVTSLFPLLETLNLSSKSRVLDVACGNGILGKCLIDRFQCLVWGTDISKVALAQCNEIGYTTELVNLDQDKMPFSGQKFDLVILSAMLEHVMEPEKIVKIAYQKLSPNGCVIILTPNIVWCFNRLLFLLGRWDHRLMGGMKGHISYRNKKQLQQMIKEAGFKDLNWDYSVFCVAGMSDFCTRGLSGWLIQKLSNLRVRFWHSLLSFNYIVLARKPNTIK